MNICFCLSVYSSFQYHFPLYNFKVLTHQDLLKLKKKAMKRYNQDDWEINMLFDRFPNGCAEKCYCVHPGEDCGCEDCQKRHAYRLYHSPILQKFKEYRLN